MIGYIKNGTITIKDIPGLVDIAFLSDANQEIREGEYKVWIREKNGSWYLYVPINEEFLMDVNSSG